MAKVIHLFDYRKAELPEHLFKIKIRHQAIEARMKEAAERFLTIEAQSGEIIENDIVAVSIKSDCPWVNSESEYFRVGQGYSYPEIEAQIKGKKVGDEFQCEIDGQPASVKVLSVKRRIVPELTDAHVVCLDIEGVSTVAEYEKYIQNILAEEDKEKKLKAVCILVNRQLIQNSEFEMAADEVENSYQNQLRGFEEEVEDANEFEQVMLHLYHAKTLDAAKENMRKNVEKEIKIQAIAECIAGQNGQSWSEKEYEAFIEASVDERTSEEEMRENVSLEDFIRMQEVEYMQTLECEFVDNRFTVEVLP